MLNARKANPGAQRTGIIKHRQCRCSISFGQFEILESRHLLAAHLVSDINKTRIAPEPRDLVAVDNLTYYVAKSAGYGNELWATDGAAASSFMVKDINPGEYSSASSLMTNVGGTLYFVAYDGEHGYELWKSNGTAETTMMVGDLNAGYYSSYFYNLTNVNGTLFFAAITGNGAGRELWKSDGTPAGTMMVKNIDGSYYSSSPDELTNVNGQLFFTADDGQTGRELWKSDGTTAGTVRVNDIRKGRPGSSISSLTNVGGVLMFSANDGTNGSELWSSDGTAAGTVMVADIRLGKSGAYPNNLTNVNGALFFSADDGVKGFELWKSTGTAAGTVMVKDINADTDGSNLLNLKNVSGTLYFSAYESEYGAELWKSDGTVSGTLMVKNIAAEYYDASPANLTDVNGTLFFTAWKERLGRELWKSDGTVNGTVLVKDIDIGYYSYPENLTNTNGTLVFTAASSSDGRQVWKSNGTQSGTSMLGGSAATLSSDPADMLNLNGTLYFTANDGVQNRRLWRSDGTETGTTGIDFGGSYPRYLTNVNGTLFFSYNRDSSTRLFKSDGTPAGTTPLSDIGLAPRFLTAVDGLVYFSAESAVYGRRLWRSDGTTEGTFMLSNSRSWSGTADPAELTNVNGRLFFTADNVNGRELWVSNGTVVGTVMVKDIVRGGAGSFPRGLVSVKDSLFFIAYDDQHGRELWKSNGTANGTVLVKDISPGANGSYAEGLTDVNGQLYFTATDGINGTGLWKSDGTSSGTVLVKQFFVGNGLPTSFTNVNGRLYFTADDGVNGQEIWTSDGTEEGTVMLKDIISGSGWGWPKYLVNVSGLLYFTANDGINGRELWISGGTASSTVMIADTFPNGTSEPKGLTNVNGTLFFSATDISISRELWAYEPEPRPSFSLASSNVIVTEDAEEFTQTTLTSLPNFATKISSGLDNAPGDLHFIIVSSSAPELFATQPSILPEGTLAFRTHPDRNGTATIVIRLDDLSSTFPNAAAHQSDLTTFTITLLPVNDRPVFSAGPNIVIAEDAAYSQNWATNIAPAAGLLNAPPTAQDEQNQKIDFVVTADRPALFQEQPTISPSGILSFTPAANASGVTLVTVVAQDQGAVTLPDENKSLAYTLTITLKPENDPPRAGSDSYSVTADQALSVSAPGVLLNDSDPDMPDDKLEALEGALLSELGARVQIRRDGSFSYDPSQVLVIDQLMEGQSLTDAFTYQVSDVAGAKSNLATVSIVLKGVNDPPVAVDDQFLVEVNRAKLLAVLNNDTDIDSPLDGASITLRSQPFFGTAVVNSSGQISYTPFDSFHGTDSFRYSVSDKDGDISNEATVSLVVNHPPTAIGDLAFTVKNLSVTVDVLGNDVDLDGTLQSGTIEITSQSSTGGQASLPGDGTITFTPAKAFVGRVSFTYVVRDNSGSVSNEATVTVQIANSLWQNPLNSLDVNADKKVTPIDSLLVINYINEGKPVSLPDSLLLPPPYFDTNGDESVTAIDALMIINYLNSGATGEGLGLVEVTSDHGDGTTPERPVHEMTDVVQGTFYDRESLALSRRNQRRHWEMVDDHFGDFVGND